MCASVGTAPPCDLGCLCVEKPCETVVRGLLKSTGKLVCPTCRFEADSYKPMISVKVALERAESREIKRTSSENKKRKASGEPEIQDVDAAGRALGKIAYIAGHSISSRGEVDYLVVWAHSGVGAPVQQWMSSAQMNAGDNIEEYHKRFFLPLSKSPEFLNQRNVRVQHGVPTGRQVGLPRTVKGKVVHTYMYKCSDCSFEKSAQSDVTKHIRDVHYQGSNFKCRICNSTYQKRNNLIRHIKSTHVAAANVTSVVDDDVVEIAAPSVPVRRGNREETDFEEMEADEAEGRIPQVIEQLL
jgi:uncharacterized Zn finger protein (UPF0148 family)